MHSFVDKLARFFAQLGGFVLAFLIVLTCASVLGRSINSILHGDFLQGVVPGIAKLLLATGVGPINGDFEIVEAAMAFAIFAFLPLCQLHAAHASVDVFTTTLSDRVNRGLQVMISVLFAAVMVVIAQRLFSGMMSKMSSGQTTLLLEFPVWWSYLASMIAATVTALVAIYVAVIRIIESAMGQSGLLHEVEANH